MEALVCRKLGDPTQPISDGGAEKAIVVEKNHPIPELGSPTSVRVRVKATSLNYANYLQILGKYQEKPPLPFIPGSDYSGTVDAVGPAVSKFKVGDPVCSFAALGSFAQFIVADQKELTGRCMDFTGVATKYIDQVGLISIHISHAYRLPEVRNSYSFLTSYQNHMLWLLSFQYSANLAFSAIKDRKVIGKVMLVLDDERTCTFTNQCPSPPPATKREPPSTSSWFSAPTLPSETRLAKGSFRSAVELFRRLREDGLCPDNFTNPFVFKAIGRGSGRSKGSWVCAFVVETGIGFDAYV
ncbi:unnamed protein product [Malus baccata var. baccata]